MIHEVDVYGVLVPPMLLWTSVAIVLTAVLSRLIGGLGLYRFIWHKPLFDLALLVIVTGALVAATPW